MIYMTLMQIIYIGYTEYYETHFAKRLEIVNESIFVLIQYCIVLLVNLVYELDVREQIGNIIIGLTAFLFTMNMVVIVYVSIRALKRKLYLRNLKKKALARQK